jgi:hypothetical protein
MCSRGQPALIFATYWSRDGSRMASQKLSLLNNMPRCWPLPPSYTVGAAMVGGACFDNPNPLTLTLTESHGSIPDRVVSKWGV